jgi:hypothetical protein
MLLEAKYRNQEQRLAENRLRRLGKSDIEGHSRRSVKRRSAPLDSRPSQSFKCFLRISLYFSYRSRHGRFSIEMLSSYYLGRLLKRDLFGGGGARFFVGEGVKGGF